MNTPTKLTEQDITSAVYEALQSGKVKTVHPRMVRAMIELLVYGNKWDDICTYHEISRGGLSRALKRVGLSPNRLK